jgi:FkbH-like protein
MKELLILGSSYLIPNNKEWSSNLNDYTLHFGDYADWNLLVAERKENQSVLLTFVLDDLVSDDSCSEDKLEETFGPLFRLIDISLGKFDNPIIASVSSGQKFDVIRYAKCKHYLQKAFFWIISRFEKLADEYNNFYLLDLKEAFAEFGNKKAFDNRNWYLAHCRFSTQGIGIIASNVKKILDKHFAPSAKVLALDCDNTIWGGVIGEDKIKGIVLGEDGTGQIFVDFQKEVKNLIGQGVIVVLSSKNNEKEVWQVFDEHDAMVLSRNDIISSRINWNEKSQSLEEIASDLDLGLDSFVFWDDNPIERDKMKTILPEVVTVDVPKDLYDWPSYLRTQFDLAKLTILKEDAKKTLQYQSRAKFVRDSNKSTDEFSYLKSIKLSPKTHQFDESNIKRATQLCSKTNQFNLRTIRYSAEDLLSLDNESEGMCFLVSLNDVYGSHGIVGLVCVKKISQYVAFLDSFLISCRVLGRHLESWMLRQAIDSCSNLGITELIGGFVQTERNIVSESFLKNHGFSNLEDNKIPSELMAFVQQNEDLYQISTSINSIPYENIYAQ